VLHYLDVVHHVVWQVRGTTRSGRAWQVAIPPFLQALPSYMQG
jgi:putative copper export protein